MKRKFLKQALRLVICLSMVCPQVMVSAAPLQGTSVQTAQAVVQSAADDGNEQVTKVAEEGVTAIVNNIAVEGESLQAAVEAAEIDVTDVTAVELRSGTVTQDDMAYIKTLPALSGLTMNLTDGLTYENGSKVLPMKALICQRLRQSVPRHSTGQTAWRKFNISLKFHDDTALDYYVLNDVKSLTGITGTWGDGNYQNIKSYLKEGNGEDGKNTLTVYDKAGNSTIYTFYCRIRSFDWMNMSKTTENGTNSIK